MTKSLVHCQNPVQMTHKSFPFILVYDPIQLALRRFHEKVKSTKGNKEEHILKSHDEI